MTTLKFKGESPYQKGPPEVPEEDFMFKRFLERVQLKKDTPNTVEFGVALFGIGRAGTFHLPNLVQNSRINLLYIVEDDISKWESVKHHWKLHNTKFLQSKDASKVYSDKRVGAVVVASPSHTHEDIVITALESGKAVLCEKPVTENLDRIKYCFETALCAKQPLLAAFNRRFDPAFSNIQSRVRQGEIGHVISIKISSKNSPLPSVEYLKSTRSIFHDTAVHDIDIILHVLGEYPTKVLAAAQANIPEIAEIGHYDFVAITMWFPSGTIAIIDLSRYSSFGYDQRMEVFGTKGMLVAGNQQPIQNVECYKNPEDLQKSPIYYGFPSRYKEAYAQEIEHFLDVLEGKCSPKISDKDVLAGCKIANACEESAKTGNTVTIYWDEQELSYPC